MFSLWRPLLLSHINYELLIHTPPLLTHALSLSPLSLSYFLTVSVSLHIHHQWIVLCFHIFFSSFVFVNTRTTYRKFNSAKKNFSNCFIAVVIVVVAIIIAIRYKNKHYISNVYDTSHSELTIIAKTTKNKDRKIKEKLLLQRETTTRNIQKILRKKNLYSDVGSNSYRESNIFGILHT